MGACKLSLLILVGCILMFVQETQSCNEAVCGSIVSKCLLTQQCKCDFEGDCTCCKECAFCLSYLYDECCSCVDMCPKPNNTDSLNKQSHVEELDQNYKVQQLFNLLTQTSDPLDRWTSITYPVDYKIMLAPKAEIKYQMQSSEQDTTDIKSDIATLNCTVAYMAECMSWGKCRSHCQSMGASSLRWFNDGCCECIGEHCINYGINESRCLKCSKKGDGEQFLLDELDAADEEELMDYGEDEFEDDYADEEPLTLSV